MRKIISFILVVAMVAFGLDCLLVVFSKGFSVTVAGHLFRSATIEFPLIALAATAFLWLLIQSKAKEALLLCGALFVSALLGEVFLRIADHPLSQPYIDYAAWYRPSEYLGHELVPGFEGRGPMDIPIKVNAVGFRDEEHVTEKPAGTIRVLGLGDSFLMGWGVKAEEIFLKQFEGLLRQSMGKTVEAINTGVPGWGLNQYYLFLQQTGVTFGPDLIVLDRLGVLCGRFGWANPGTHSTQPSVPGRFAVQRGNFSSIQAV